MTKLEEYIALLEKKRNAENYNTFFSETSIGGLSSYDSPIPVEFTIDDENRMFELKKELENG